MSSAWKCLPVLFAGILIPLSLPAAPADPNPEIAKYVELVMFTQERTPVASLAKNVLDPSSVHYQVYYSPEEIRDVSAPLDADYNALIANLKAKGAQIVRESPTHLVLTVKMPKTKVEKLFGMSLIYTADGRHKPSRAVRIPTALKGIASVSGLDTTRKSHSKFTVKQVPMSGQGDFPEGVTPDYMKKLYDFDPIVKSGITGKGQHIAIAGYDAYIPMDVARYRSTFVDYHSVGKVDEVFFNGTPGPEPESAAENDLDAEFAGMVAPDAQIHLFLSEHNDDPGEVQLFTAILDDNRAKVANYSWGDCETHVTAQHRADMDKVFARAVAQGVTIIAASGDWGSNGCPDNNTPTADWPGAHEHIMSVGGTSIWESTFGHKLTEEAWEGTGGGFSAVYKAPAWQATVSSSPRRGFPDVSFNADPNTGEPAFLSYPAIPKWIQVGGTSIGAPQWSGFVALLNEARGARGPIGFLPPYLYNLTSEQRAKSFRDIVKGKNGAYRAAVGWDPTTGFGSPLAGDLLAQLVGL